MNSFQCGSSVRQVSEFVSRRFNAREEHYEVNVQHHSGSVTDTMEVMENLGDRVLYFNTDSCIFIEKKEGIFSAVRCPNALRYVRGREQGRR